MTYGYIRVSTSHQNLENQQMEIEKFCQLNGLKIDSWIEEKISGTKRPENRKLGKILMNSAHSGDLIICTEIFAFWPVAHYDYERFAAFFGKRRKSLDN